MGAGSILEIPGDVLDSARLTAAELKVEMAVHLYAQGRLSAGKARELAGMTLWEFRQLLASRRVSPHYDAPDLDEDLTTSVGSARGMRITKNPPAGSEPAGGCAISPPPPGGEGVGGEVTPSR